MAAVDGQALLQEAVAKLKAEQERLGLSQAGALVDKLSEAKEDVAKGVGQILEQVHEGIRAIMDKIDEAMKDPRALVPGGKCVSMCGSYYARRIAKALEEVKKGADALVTIFVALAKKAAETLAKLGASLPQVAQAVGDAMKRMLALPDTIKDMAALVKEPSDLASLDLGAIKAQLDAALWDKPLGELAQLKGAVGPLFADVQGGTATLATFLLDAPKRIKRALPKSCCTSVMPAPLEAVLENLQRVKGLDLQPVQGLLTKVQASVGDLDVDAVKKPMDGFSKTALESIQPLDLAVQAAKLQQGVGGTVMNFAKGLFS